MKKILVTGLCTLHWGRLQYGNIGNYYIVEPLFRQLHKYFPDYKILTTFQMDETFIRNEDVEVVNMDFYYSWNPDKDVANAYTDVEIAQKIVNGELVEESEFVSIVRNVDAVINVSGDMWGDNAEHVGHNRFLVDCLKMKAAQTLGIKTFLFAVTPGPFSTNYDLAKDVFEHFDGVYIREKVSNSNLTKWGFALDNVSWAPCPSYLFEPNSAYRSKWTEIIDENHDEGKKVIGFTIGGFNMPIGPYDMWPREDSQYDVFVDLIKHIFESTDATVMLFSHTNGFELPPKFRLINGRDYIILEQLYRIICSRFGEYASRIVLIDEPLLPCNIKSVIGKMDMLITGRVHASVAATSQYIPTVYIEYDRRVIYSDKMLGFSGQIGMSDYVCEPSNLETLIVKFDNCYANLNDIRNQLITNVNSIKREADNVFSIIKQEVIDE